MIHFFVGKPRNGKSLRAMMEIWRELTEGNRHVITNMVILLDVLQALLIARGFPHVNVRDRLTMLDDAQTKDFWLHRPGFVLERPDGYSDKTGPDVDYSPCFDPETGEVKSVLYVIDEVHTHWRARGWAGTPRHVDFYNSQHGKLGDMVIFITQNTKLVDQNFVRLAQDFAYCRNHRLEKHGRFRGDNKFTVHTYPGPVTSPNEVTLNVETFKLDLPLAECYDTSAGVGMPGGGKADAGFRAKGVPLKLVWVGLGLGALVVWFLIAKVGPGLVSKHFSGIAGVPDVDQTPVPRMTDEQLRAPYANGGSVANAPRSAPPPPPPPPPAVKPSGIASAWVLDDVPEEPLWVTGRGWGGGKFYVWLSDGRCLREGDAEVKRIDARGVVLADGRRVWMRPVRGASPRPADQVSEVADVSDDEPSDPVTSGDDPVPSAEGDVTALAPPIVRTAPRT